MLFIFKFSLPDKSYRIILKWTFKKQLNFVLLKFRTSINYHNNIIILIITDIFNLILRIILKLTKSVFFRVQIERRDTKKHFLQLNEQYWTQHPTWHWETVCTFIFNTRVHFNCYNIYLRKNETCRKH